MSVYILFGVLAVLWACSTISLYALFLNLTSTVARLETVVKHLVPAAKVYLDDLERHDRESRTGTYVPSENLVPPLPWEIPKGSA